MSSALHVLSENGKSLHSQGKKLTDTEVVAWEDSVLDVINFIWGQYDSNGAMTKEYQSFISAKTLEDKLEVLQNLMNL